MLTDPAAKFRPPARNDVRTYKGIAASPGIAIGRAVIIERREASVFRVPIREEEVGPEVTRFLGALDKTRDELGELKQKVSRSMGGRSSDSRPRPVGGHRTRRSSPSRFSCRRSSACHA